MERIEREPCPWRMVDDAGGAFVFGLVGGSVWHAVGGFRNASSGNKFEQMFSRVKARTPVLGGSFAVWGTLFSLCDCTFTYIRKKEDPWNAIISGAATGGILAARAGMKAAGKSAMVGGIILAAIEGLNLLLMRVIMPSMEKNADQSGMTTIDTLLPPIDPTRSRITLNKSNGGRSQSIYEAAPTLGLPSGGPEFDSRHPAFDSEGFGKSVEFASSSVEEPKKSQGWFW